MKYKLIFFLPLLATGCMRTSAYEISTIVPLGTPSICYFDQGSNENFYTNEPATILPLFQNPNPLYDALVIDSFTGLLHSKQHNSPYKMAKLLTAGNLYLVGLNQNIKEPTNDSVIYAFQENQIPGLVFKHLCRKYLKYDINRINWVDNINLILPIARDGFYHGSQVDYILIAEPMLYSIKASGHSAISSYSISLRDLWHLATNQDIIPQAALFINKNAYQQKKKLFKTYLQSLNTRIEIAINDVDKVKEELNHYGDNDAQVMRFGFNAETIVNVQKDGNRLALYPSTEEYNYNKMNAFLDKLELSIHYSQEDFINIDDEEN